MLNMMRTSTTIAATVPTDAAALPRADSQRRTIALLALLAAGSTALWFVPLAIDARPHHALAISAFMIAAWMIQVLDHGVIGIVGCFLFWSLGVAKFEDAFSGFADATAWFLFGAICIGMMAEKSGLARRIAFLVMRRV